MIRQQCLLSCLFGFENFVNIIVSQYLLVFLDEFHSSDLLSLDVSPDPGPPHIWITRMVDARYHIVEPCCIRVAVQIRFWTNHGATVEENSLEFTNLSVWSNGINGVFSDELMHIFSTQVLQIVSWIVKLENACL